MANFSLGKHPHVELCDLLKAGRLERKRRAGENRYLPTAWSTLTAWWKPASAAKSSPVKR
ncbi:ribosome-associated protein [Klebsiella michiganensis]|uniref:Ribosome-associated protein n=1 Tax=Klebsiella michiganensis TaxID=1134687 RepID=A0A7H4LYB1_9ENTR|nr:ribosome-associated protein [Klebsiella michiganensis]